MVMTFIGFARREQIEVWPLLYPMKARSIRVATRTIFTVGLSIGILAFVLLCGCIYEGHIPGETEKLSKNAIKVKPMLIRSSVIVVIAKELGGYKFQMQYEHSRRYADNLSDLRTK